MEIIKVENLSFAYPNRKNKALDNINISVNCGDFITLCGKSGCGKTTLLRLLKPTLAPSGSINGNIFFGGKALKDITLRDQAEKIGFVMQSPDNQIVTDKVWHELAFGLESLGIKNSEIRTKVAEMASFFGIQEWFYKNVTELSGGQKQLLNLASVMVMNPMVLILDEPTSQLDPIAASEFLRILEKINRELGTTIILSEHRLEEAFPISHRVIVMDQGKIIADDLPKNVGQILKSQNHPMCKALPTPMKIHAATENNLSCPITIREGRIWLEEITKTITPDLNSIPKSNEIPYSPIIELKDIWFRYEKQLPDIIKGLNVQINKGELFAIVGGNGTGKTTTLSVIAGLNTPYRGQVIINGENIKKTQNNGLVGMLPQNPQSIFVKKTVYLDLMEILSETELSEEEKENRIKTMAKLCRIETLFDFHPYDLSGGEQQRAALAKILLLSPEILLLDEPTKGLDAHFKETFASILSNLKASGTTVVMVSHDIEFCSEHADRCAMFFDGNITSIDAPREFFCGKSFYTTAANKMARTTIPNAVIANDIIAALGGKIEKPKINETAITPIKSEKAQKPEVQNPPKNLKTRSLPVAILTMLLIVLTIYSGKFFGDRKYFITSILIMLETMIPFFLSFEHRKPRPRELVIISVLCAIAVAGRSVFFMLPQFKPVVALIIISGLCFGGETGFLVGAVTGFVSNFFFGQGPWTPWQMFALGIIGFIAGILFNKDILRKNRLLLCTFGFFATFVIYGGIMNPASLFMYQAKITGEMIISAYAAGFSLDLIHSLSTVIFLFILANPMIDILERIKTKYGLIKK